MSSDPTTVVSIPSPRCDSTFARRRASPSARSIHRNPVFVKPHSPPTRARPVREPRERRPGELRLGQQVVVHPDEAARPPGRAGADPRPLHDDHRRPALGEVEGQARPVHAGADDDDVRRVGHALLPVPPARAGSPFSIGQVGRLRAKSPADRELRVPRLERAGRLERPQPLVVHALRVRDGRAGVAHPPQPVLVHLAGRAGRVDHDGHAVAEVEQPEGRVGDADVGLEPSEHGRAAAGMSDRRDDLGHRRQPEDRLDERRSGPGRQGVEDQAVRRAVARRILLRDDDRHAEHGGDAGQPGDPGDHSIDAHEPARRGRLEEPRLGVDDHEHGVVPFEQRHGTSADEATRSAPALRGRTPRPGRAGKPTRRGR